MTATVYTQQESDARLADLEQRLEALEAGTPEPPDPTVPTGGLVYGYSKDQRARLEADTGVYVNAERSFADKCPTSWANSDMASLPTRYHPFMSFKPGSGHSWSNPNTTAFRSFVASIPRHTVVIPSHEPENDNGNPEAFQSQLITYADVVADVGNPFCHLAINLMTSWSDKASGQGGSIAYIPDPSELAVPVGLTWDGYRPVGKETQSPAQIYATPLQIIEDSGYAWWGICETAAETHADEWVRECPEWVASEGGLACLYWPSQVQEPGAVDWYPPASAFDEFAEVALLYGGQEITSRYA